MPKKERMHYRNEFHRASTFVKAKVEGSMLFISWEQHSRALARLCSVEGCCCEPYAPEQIVTMKEGFFAEHQR